MPAPAGTAGMAPCATRRTAQVTGTISTQHQMVRWRGPAGIVRKMVRRESGT